MLERWFRHAWLPYAGVLFALAAGILVKLSFGTQTALLVWAGAALIAIILLFWSSLQSLTGSAPLTLEEALGMGAPRAEEEQKRAVLRALKDLEYERSVGKISDEDYAELSSRYRAEAKRLIRALDEEAAPLREQVEKLVAKRLSKAMLGASAAAEQPEVDERPVAHAPDEDEKAEAEAVEVSKAEAASEAQSANIAVSKPRSTKAPTRACAGCGTQNELDALFCKRCGKRQAKESELLCSACPAVYDRELSQCPECGVVAEAV